MISTSEGRRILCFVYVSHVRYEYYVYYQVERFVSKAGGIRMDWEIVKDIAN